MLKCQALGQDCVADVSSAYALLEAVNRQQLDAASTAPKVAAMLIRAVEKRTSKEKIRGSLSRGHTNFDIFKYVFWWLVWVNYNDLTATSLESWLVRGIIPKWP